MYRKLRVCLALLAISLGSGCSAPSPSAPGPQPSAASAPQSSAARQVGPAEFASIVDRGQAFVINVHVPDEGSIAGTDAAIPFDQIRARAAELPQDRAAPLAVYCRSGRMSAIAMDTLTALGYRDVVELRGGMIGWQAEGRALVPAGS